MIFTNLDGDIVFSIPIADKGLIVGDVVTKMLLEDSEATAEVSYEDNKINFTFGIPKGKTGADGYSPTVEVAKNTDTEYALTIASKDGKIVTPNMKGKDGTAATIGIGTIKTGEAGTNANVVNVGTDNEVKLDFVIPKGKDGKSAYEIAVENGFVGTEGDWLESLRGEKGEGFDLVDLERITALEDAISEVAESQAVTLERLGG